MSDPTDITNWLRLSDRLTTSGQPDEAQLVALRGIGVDHVINLALHTYERALPDEAASAAALGMAYTHIPVAFDAPTEADYARFRDAMDAIGEGRVHVHCIMNYRVSAFLYRYRRDALQMPEPDARASMERIWQPGGAWAAIIGDDAAVEQPHRYTDGS